MKYQKLFRQFLLPFLALLFSSCSSTEALKTLDANEITLIGKSCKELIQGQIDAWASKDPKNLRLIYSDDIVHFDGKPLFVGIDAVVRMAEDMYTYFPNWQMKAGETYISKDECVGTWVNWNVFSFTQDHPGLEFDFLTTRDSKISFWRLFYDQNFHRAFGNKDRVDDNFLLQFASSWSSGNAGKVVRMYAQDAELEDGLFGISIIGKQAIREYANSFFAKSPKAKWELIYPFAESEVASSFKEQYPFASQGGIFSISVNDIEGNPCEIRVVVILTPNEHGKILTQKTFYESNMLLTCGWAR